MRLCILHVVPLAFALLLGVAGCGTKTVKVGGTVTFDGAPLPNAIVKFIPTVKDGREATGLTNADGTFQLETFAARDGVLPGDYKVTVQYQEPLAVDTDVPPTQPGKSMKARWDATQKAMKEQQKKPPKYVIPAKYSHPVDTILKQRVPPDGPVRFELRSKDDKTTR
jgi:hypothetical protein